MKKSIGHKILPGVSKEKEEARQYLRTIFNPGVKMSGSYNTDKGKNSDLVFRFSPGLKDICHGHFIFICIGDCQFTYYQL